MRNIDYYIDNIASYIAQADCLRECSCSSCEDECICSSISRNKEQVNNWLLEEHNEKIKLKQWEYDLLINCKEALNEDGKEDDVIQEWWIITGMKEKGHFKNVETDMTFKEVLDNCEIVD